MRTAKLDANAKLIDGEWSRRLGEIDTGTNRAIARVASYMTEPLSRSTTWPNAPPFALPIVRYVGWRSVWKVSAPVQAARCLVVLSTPAMR